MSEAMLEVLVDVRLLLQELVKQGKPQKDEPVLAQENKTQTELALERRGKHGIVSMGQIKYAYKIVYDLKDKFNEMGLEPRLDKEIVDNRMAREIRRLGYENIREMLQEPYNELCRIAKTWTHGDFK